jgi:hypothetical protein
VNNGPWIGLHPKDKSVVDMKSAIVHEYNVHLTPAANVVKRSLDKLEARSFASEQECDTACKEAKTSTRQLFLDVLTLTQRAENKK